VAIIALLVVDAENEWPAALKNVFVSWAPLFTLAALWVTVALTVVSGWIYLWRNRALYLDDM